MKTDAAFLASAIVGSMIAVSDARAQDESPIEGMISEQRADLLKREAAIEEERNREWLTAVCPAGYLELCKGVFQDFRNEVTGAGLSYGSWKLNKALGKINSRVLTDEEIAKDLKQVLGNDKSPEEIEAMVPKVRRLASHPAVRHAPKFLGVFGLGLASYDLMYGEPTGETVDPADPKDEEHMRRRVIEEMMRAEVERLIRAEIDKSELERAAE